MRLHYALCFSVCLLSIAACNDRRGVRAALDGGPRDDASTDLDGGPAVDAGAIDGGPPGDAGGATDAGPRVDGGPAVTTCMLSVAPLVGAETDDFVFTGASNGSLCSARVDGGATVAMPCTGMLSYAGSFFGVGAHIVELLVGDGPSGPTQCTASLTVSGGVGTTCAITVTPPSGVLATIFVASFASNGTGCTAAVDATSIGAVDCMGSFSGMGSLIGVGSHTGTLYVGDGPGGPTACSTPFLVAP